MPRVVVRRVRAVVPLGRRGSVGAGGALSAPGCALPGCCCAPPSHRSYVPVDTDAPHERLRFILADTKSPLLLTDVRNRPDCTAADPGVPVLAVDEAPDAPELPCHAPGLPLIGSDLAYVIYTSGTTGRPKGVLCEHGGLVNRIQWMNRMFPLGPNDRVLQKTPYVFDVSVWELLWAVWYGAAVVFAEPGAHKDPYALTELIERERVTVIHFVPSMFAVFLEAADGAAGAPAALSGLRLVFCSGEELKPAQVRDAHRLLPGARLHNLYGPTEASIDVLHHPCTDPDPDTVPIGTPVDNTQVYVLNAARRPLPVHAVGELYLGGAQLARGYLNRPELTAERFVPNPFGEGRLYRTGDLVRQRNDGSIEYLGRDDFQVKIRGYRIELGEIEAALTRCPGVRQAVALVRNADLRHPYLVGYYVADHPLDETTLTRALHETLPPYMVPGALVHLAELPVTVNGKLDRRALPDPGLPQAREERLAPHTPLEERVRDLWADCLGMRPADLGVLDDVRRLGMDSIVAIRVASRLRKELGVTLAVRDIFSLPTVAQVAALAEPEAERETGTVADAAVVAEQGVLSGEVALLPVQEWFFGREFVRPGHWNQAFLVRVPELDRGRLEEALRGLVERHDALRLRFREGVQFYDVEASFPGLRVMDVRGLPGGEGSPEFVGALRERLTGWQSGFDLERGPMASFGYLHGFSDGSARVFFALHHLITDTVSWRILAEDLHALYEGRELGVKGTSYRQWSQAVAEYARRRPEERAYWENLLTDLDEAPVLRQDTGALVDAHVTLDASRTAQLLGDCHRAYGTRVDEFLLAAFTLALADVTGRPVQHLMVEGHGREDVEPGLDVSRTLGWFTTLHPVRVETYDDARRTLASVKDGLRAVPGKGLGHGPLCGYDRPLPRVCFNYLGRIDAATGPWQITTEPGGDWSHPDNLLPYAVTATGMVSEGRLRFTLSCRLPEPDARRIARAFEDRLTALVDSTARGTRTHLTVSDIDGLLPQEHLDRLQANRELDGVFAATSLQQGFIQHAVAQGDIDDAYRVQAVWDYQTALEPDLYRAAWEQVQRDFAALRLRFDWQHEMVQVVDREAQLTWQYLDLSGHPDAAGRDAAFQALLEGDRATPYDLRAGGLFRVHLVKQDAERFTCVLNTHHAILDGWSSPLLLRALHDAYLALRDGRPVAPAGDDYAVVQRGLRRSAHAHDAFWRAYVADAGDGCDLGGLLRPEARGTDLATHRRVLRQEQQTLPLPPDLLGGLRSVAQDHGVTLNALLQYAWHKVLGCYGRADTTVVGTVLAGRDLPVDGIETSVGLYLSTVPLIARHGTGADSVIEEVQRLQDDLHEISRRSSVDLAALQAGGRRLFDSLFIYENYPAITDERHERELRPRFRFRHQKRDYPLVVSVTEQDGQVTLVLDHAGELFAPETARRLLAGVETVLRTVSDDPAAAPSDLVLTAPRTALRDEAEWNDSGTAEPAEPVIHRAFEAQAARTPTAPAVTHGGTTLTYAALNTAANRLARVVRQQVPLAPEEPVLLLLDRGTDTVTGLLAVLKAGCAYVPLDPGYPDERIARIAEGSGARLLLTHTRHRDRMTARFPGMTVLAVDAPETRAACAAERPDDLDLPVTGDSLAYVLYTSGTTGQPKGVMVEHRAFTTTMAALRRRHFPEAGPLHTYSLTNYVFDIFGLEYGLTLLGGGSMTVGDHPVAELDCSVYDFVQMTPSLLEMTLPALRRLEDTRLLVGGERLDRHLLRAALRRCPRVVNVYGPTETTIWSTSRAYTAADADGPLLVTIGRPLPNETAHILDAQLRPLPAGAIGELYLGGAALARGYLGDPELTRDRFVDASAAGFGCLYRTGDLARRRDDGEIEFVGRADDQIKLRGHRIELGEVESALVSFEGVRQSAVVVGSLDGSADTPDSARSLIGYYVADRALDEDALRGHLAALLPEYMRLAALVHLTELPLTYSGKLDVKALPAARRRTARSTPAAPSDDTERLLARLWQDVLGLDEVDVHDRFFDVGGNSVLLTKVHARLPEEIRRTVTLTDLFRLPTIASLAAHVTGRHVTGRRADDPPRREPAAQPAAPGHRDGGDSRDIAIIGMAGRFPDADDLEEFWHNLVTGHHSVVRPTRAELLAAGVPEQEIDQPGYVRARSGLRDIRSFDAAFFGYSPREARTMDPQHRVFLECAWHALEDAHCDPAAYDGDIGVYAGAGHNDYAQEHVLPSLGETDLATRYQVMIHNQGNFLCTKVAYKLGLTGPAVTVQTACSTSLVAVHQACTALLAGDCDVALAGGVSIGKLRAEGYVHQDGMVFSPDGTCRAFDADAQGTIEGQGVGIVVLKRLDRALADGDRVRTVIKATAINNDGRNKVGYTAPSQERQAAVIRRAHERAGIDPATIGYVEAHGTGTPLGDPIEVAALREAFTSGGTVPHRVALGSVKTNIGHLDVASGIAGLIKTVLCLEHRTLVPTLHHTRPNPRLELESTPFHIVTETTPWSDGHPVRRAGVSSFGIGGTNAHVVLEEAPPRPGPAERRRDQRTHTLFVVSAPAPDALDRQSRALARHAADHPDVPLERLAYTLHTARHRFPHRRVVVAGGHQDLVERLAEPSHESVTHRPGRPVVFLFPGQGAQYRDMGRALYASEPGFRAHVDHCRELLRGRVGEDASEADLLGRTDRVGDTRFTHVALFVVEYALARWFTDLGVRPDAVIGHSLGAYPAACLAGVLSLEDALSLVAERGRLLAGTATGTMLAVPLPEHQVRGRLARHGLDLAAVNDATSCVVSGPAVAVDALTAELAAEGVTGRRLAVSHAFHSRLLNPVLDRFTKALEGVRLMEPELPFVSELTGDWADPNEVCRPAYWRKHLRRTVRFHDGLSTLYGDARLRDAVLLEVGPGRALGRSARRHPDRDGRLVVAAMPPAGDAAQEEPTIALHALGTAWAAGADMDAEAFHGLTAGDRLPLPGYAFARQEHWIDRAAPTGVPARPNPPVPTNTSPAAPAPTATEVLSGQAPNRAPDEAAATVAESWRTVLGVDTVHPDDDFFAQGGDSLAAVQLVARLRALTGADIEFMALERHTPQVLTQALAQRLAGDRAEEDMRRGLVVIKVGDPQARPPLVLVHPIGGDVFFYRELAACLPGDQAVYAIRSPLLDGTVGLDTIEDMAASYLERLEEFGLKPPYRLGGSSFGGLVAYEMARQLDARDAHRPPGGADRQPRPRQPARRDDRRRHPRLPHALRPGPAGPAPRGAGGTADDRGPHPPDRGPGPRHRVRSPAVRRLPAPLSARLAAAQPGHARLHRTPVRRGRALLLPPGGDPGIPGRTGVALAAAGPRRLPGRPGARQPPQHERDAARRHDRRPPRTGRQR
ncbi:amino acid adenylation domain-containing protein [Streptomyces althioticus]|uniref:amino acid adenylation domain-containing protein n=1 Tax=Streptomyces althioticus TaxID=83380 RepID=UPI0036A1DF7D